MGKKKDKPRYKTFNKMLRENAKKIYVAKDGKKISLVEATEYAVDNVTSVPLEGIIPVSSSEAAEKRTASLVSIDARYTNPVFSLYEQGVKYSNNQQTLVITVDADEADDLFNDNIKTTITSLLERTNINLILSDLDKSKAKIKKWLGKNATEEAESYILNIPDVILFTGNINKKEISNAIFINVMIQIVKTIKPLEKLKKKNADRFEKIIEKVVDDTINASINLGNSSILIGLDAKFTGNIERYLDYWVSRTFDNDVNKKLFNFITFSITNSADFIEFSRALIQKTTSV